MNVKLAFIRSVNFILFFMVLFFLLYSLLNIVLEKAVSGQLLLRSFREIALPAVLAGLLYSFFVKRERKTVPVAKKKESLRQSVLTAVSQMGCRICRESESSIVFCHRSFGERVRFIFDDRIRIFIQPDHLVLEGRRYLINQFLTYLGEESNSDPLK